MRSGDADFANGTEGGSYLSEGGAGPRESLGPLLVYSPFMMERSKQQCVAAGAAEASSSSTSASSAGGAKSCISSQKELGDFLIR